MMDRPEYLMLQRSPDPRQNIRASVIFRDGGMVRDQHIAMAEILTVLDGRSPEMCFDEHPYLITRLDFDFRKQTLKIYVEPLAATHA